MIYFFCLTGTCPLRQFSVWDFWIAGWTLTYWWDRPPSHCHLLPPFARCHLPISPSLSSWSQLHHWLLWYHWRSEHFEDYPRWRNQQGGAWFFGKHIRSTRWSAWLEIPAKLAWWCCLRRALGFWPYFSFSSLVPRTLTFTVMLRLLFGAWVQILELAGLARSPHLFCLPRAIFQMAHSPLRLHFLLLVST